MKRATVVLVAMSLSCVFGLGGSPARATFPGANGKIVFDSYSTVSETSSLYVFDMGSNEVAPFTDLVANVPHWSGDGTMLSIDALGSNEEVWVVDADGTLLRNVSKDKGDEGWSTISPDGRKVAYIKKAPSGRWQIYIQKVFGPRRPRRITNLQEFPWRLDWSPDGRRIAFLNPTKSGINEIFTIKVDGSGLRRITYGGYAHTVSWAPSGRSLIFSSYRNLASSPDPALCTDTPLYATCDYDLYSISSDGSGEKQLTSGPALDWSPSWSPDERLIAFSSNRELSEEFDIYVMDADGGNVRKVAGLPGASDANPSWQPLEIP